MKKFALLGAVAALATAGGVFAAWQFDHSTSIAGDSETISVTITDETVDIKGTGTLDVNSTLSFTVARDDGNSTYNDNEYTVTVTGKVTAQYTKATGTTTDLGATVTFSAAEVDVGGYFTINEINKAVYVEDGETAEATTTVDIVITSITTKDQFDDFVADIKAAKYIVNVSAEVGDTTGA